MFLNKKKDENPAEKDSLQPAIRNYKFRFIKFYTLVDSLIDEKKHFRKVFEQDEITYLYWEIALFNKIFYEADWSGNLVTKCYKVDVVRL